MNIQFETRVGVMGSIIAISVGIAG
jgi:hypothetical protein